MTDILDLIKSRRTIKNFQPKFVSWENVSRILEAARHAPSSGNLQNWKFIVVFEQDQKQQLAGLCYQQYEIVPAGVLIVVCAEPEKTERYYGQRGKDLYPAQNCAAAIENMLLEAHSLGLGTRWIGAFDEDKVKARFMIPEEVRVEAIIAVGYAQDIPEKPPRYPLEVLVYFGKWRGRMRDPAKYMNDYATILARKAGKLQKAAKENFAALVGKTKAKINSEDPLALGKKSS